MKKLISVLTLVFTLVLSLGFLEVEAADPLIEVYPYDNIDCSLGLASCPGAKVGRNNWTVTYNGYRYWVVNDNTRYGHEIADDDSSGFIEPGEFKVIGWNAFGTLWINNTENTMKLKGNDARSDITSVTHRIWTYFDAEGVLQILENQIHTIHMVNDNHGQEGQPANWRLATALEAEAYDAAAADEKPANMLNTHYRIKRVPKAQDNDGYIMEPLKYIQWVHKDYDKDVEGSVKSTIFDYDPVQVHIPAGWTAFSFGTLDRDARYKPALDMILSLPAKFLEDTPEKMVAEYNNVPAAHLGFSALDDNPYVPGVQIVAEFDQPFAPDFSNLSATYTRMYDAENNIVNERNIPIDFAIEIKDGDTVLKTVDFIYDPVAKKYTPTSTTYPEVPTNAFEKTYDLVMKTTTPAGVEGQVSGVIVVGVLPNRFENVSNKIIRDGEHIDLLAGIKAYDGNDGDITDNIVVSWSDGFNPYNPQPGKYTVTLDVHQDYHWEPVLTWPKAEEEKTGFYFELRDGATLIKEYSIAYPTKYNVPFNKDASPILTMIDEKGNHLFSSIYVAWGSIAIVVKDGKVIHHWNLVNGKYTGPDGVETGNPNGLTLAEHIKTFQLQSGEYMLIGHGTPYVRPEMQTAWGKDVVMVGRPAIDYTAEAQATFQVTVDDRTAPQVRVVNPTYIVDSTMFETVDQAILANVVAFDNFSDVDLIVNDDGGLDLEVPGTYTVKVDAEDAALNSSSVTFTVTVVAPKLNGAEVAALLEEQAAELQEVIDAQAALIAAQQAALAALETQVEEDNATKAELQEAQQAAAAEAAAAQQAAEAAQQAAQAAQQAAQNAQTTADDNATQIDKVDDAKLGTGANIGLMILFALIGAGLSFGASFLLFGRKK